MMRLPTLHRPLSSCTCSIPHPNGYVHKRLLTTTRSSTYGTLSLPTYYHAQSIALGNPHIVPRGEGHFKGFQGIGGWRLVRISKDLDCDLMVGWRWGGGLGEDGVSVMRMGYGGTRSKVTALIDEQFSGVHLTSRTRSKAIIIPRSFTARSRSRHRYVNTFRPSQSNPPLSQRAPSPIQHLREHNPFDVAPVFQRRAVFFCIHRSICTAKAQSHTRFEFHMLITHLLTHPALTPPNFSTHRTPI